MNLALIVPTDIWPKHDKMQNLKKLSLINYKEAENKDKKRLI